ncbi:sensor histidine kinase [Nitrospirillum pindoramense]|uniref:histidine kinase n=1 Tax=Nitrospirillum amazonense TaxID=28077 RepID=A0A560HCY3_9PROT|nr:ATP-binding protein [Nitrospirillum amazonense]TWB44228.1 phospho-acceptor domain-containing protein [Nitrospirillum amazonense]
MTIPTEQRHSSGVFWNTKKKKSLGSAIIPTIAVIITAAVFIIDTITPYEISAATFYVVVVLLSSIFCRTTGVLSVSAVCSTLTVVSFILTPDGNYRSGIANTSISLLAIGATTYLAIRIETARLLTERAQADLAHVARVTTLGEMAASIAHEVNQPLAAIITNANACTRWLRATPPNLEKIGESIASMVDDAERASDIIRRVRALATRGELKKAPVGINDVIRDVVALMQSRLREDQVTVRTHLAEDLPMVFGDHVQLQQVVLNLLTNAVDAINAAPGAKREIRIDSSERDKNDVMVRVEDGGVGIAPGVMSTLFDAFKSTKQGGMGIGLSICRSIIESHGGAIWATPNKTAGATFHFTVPGERKKTP